LWFIRPEVSVESIFFCNLKNVEKASIWDRFVARLKFNRSPVITWIIHPKMAV